MKTRTHRTSLVENVIEIARSPEEVFDYWVDLERELEWNPKAKRVEKLTAGPIGLGTRFEGEYLKGDAMTIEYVRFERPVSWETVGRSPRLNVKGEGRLTTSERGTRLVMRMELSPKGALRPLAPILGRFMGRTARLFRGRAWISITASRSLRSDGYRPTGARRSPRGPR
ncbi:MAG TPA: SRPBCC family protein [Gaiellaceae bacterium]|nr:SRPBCC family protein [Anaeromyxobacteraceae bacterium]HUK96577.1 SRPBCC family protein [Gaiellaceae bacterium]